MPLQETNVNVFGYVTSGVQYPLKQPIAIAAYDSASVGNFAALVAANAPTLTARGCIVHRLVVLAGSGVTTFSLRNARAIPGWAANSLFFNIQIDPTALPYLPYIIELGPSGLYVPAGIGASAAGGAPQIQIVYSLLGKSLA